MIVFWGNGQRTRTYFCRKQLREENRTGFLSDQKSAHTNRFSLRLFFVYGKILVRVHWALCIKTDNEIVKTLYNDVSKGMKNGQKLGESNKKYPRHVLFLIIMYGITRKLSIKNRLFD